MLLRSSDELGIVKWVQKAGWKVGEREYPVFNARVVDIATHPRRAAATRASKANVYVMGLLAVLCPCNDGTFSGLLQDTQHGHLKQALDF